jgi:hypothetical protein
MDVGELMPFWIQASFNVCDPLEVAAGNDVVPFRMRFGKRMAFRGGLDTREAQAQSDAPSPGRRKRVDKGTRLWNSLNI